MTATCATLQHRPLRAPRGDGETLQIPPLSEAAGLWQSNRELFSCCAVDFFGTPLVDLRPQAQAELLNLSIGYTQQYRGIDASLLSKWQSLQANGADFEIVLSGHQPQLFHPGVWYKNFAISRLASELNGIGVNLVIDNDACETASIQVPAGTIDQPVLKTVALDDPAAAVPYELRGINNQELFSSFGERVALEMKEIISEPLLQSMWRKQSAELKSLNNLGRRVSAMRHWQEGEWGLNTLELPLSQVCQTESFARFSACLLFDLARFKQIYNESLWEYRRVHHLRSQSHPVPDLTEDDKWTEAPFWVWTREANTRHHLFVEQATPNLIRLTDQRGTVIEIEREFAVEQLMALQTQGVFLRPRALITTMYSRLVLSQLFLHGIGGAKYDQLTDQIICRFFEMEPPAFMTLTATVLLPVERPRVSEDDLKRIDWLTRGLDYHPELYLDVAPKDTGLVNEIVANKRRWIDSDLPRGNRRERHRGITSANMQMQPFVKERRQQLLRERRVLETELGKARLLGSREFSFCIYPEGYLRDSLTKLAAVHAKR